MSVAEKSARRTVWIELSDELILAQDPEFGQLLDIGILIRKRGDRSQVFQFKFQFPAIGNADPYRDDVSLLMYRLRVDFPGLTFPDRFADLTRDDFGKWAYEVSPILRLPPIKDLILKCVLYCDPYLVDPDGQFIENLDLVREFLLRNASVLVVPSLLAGVLCVEEWVKKNTIWVMAMAAQRLVTFRQSETSAKSPGPAGTTPSNSPPSRPNSFSLVGPKTTS